MVKADQIGVNIGDLDLGLSSGWGLNKTGMFRSVMNIKFVLSDIKGMMRNYK